MTSARTIKTLAYLMAAMTAVTLVLGLVESWTVSLRAQQVACAQEPSSAVPVLVSVPRATWEKIELVLAAQEADKPADLPEAHLIIRADGRVEATRLWRMGQPLPQHVLRVCAVYSGEPSDDLLHRWLGACNQAAQQTNVQAGTIRLGTTAQTRHDPVQAQQLKDLHRRLSEMLHNWPAAS